MPWYGDGLRTYDDDDGLTFAPFPEIPAVVTKQAVYTYLLSWQLCKGSRSYDDGDGLTLASLPEIMTEVTNAVYTYLLS